jgi:hypothetical protein
MARRANSLELFPGLVPVGLLLAGIPFAVWTAYALVSDAGADLVPFFVLAGWFVILGCAHLGLLGTKGIAWATIPVLLTIRAIVEFGAIPIWRAATGDEQVDSVYMHAMELALIGFICFWVASLLTARTSGFSFSGSSFTTNRTSFFAVLLLIVGIAGRLVAWKLGLSGYRTGGSADIDSSRPYVGILNSISGLLDIALVASTIEVFGKRSNSLLIRGVFWTSALACFAFGLVSGMKEDIIGPFVLIALVSAITRRRIPSATFLIPLLFLLIAPFVTAYRRNLISGYRGSTPTLDGQVAAIQKTVSDELDESSSASAQQNTFVYTAQRLDLLADLRDIVGLPNPSLLSGDEKIWLAPFYPFVPRILWRSKPVLDKGTRLSVALGRPETTSSASTPIGDLYSLYGLWGIVVGMSIYGIMVQIYMNRASARPLTEKTLLVYVLCVFPLINLEVDMTALVAGFVLAIVKFSIIARIFYGRTINSR